ncbi:MAG: pyrroline-5-carboxylate reductase [Actinomycetota bacterium]
MSTGTLGLIGAGRLASALVQGWVAADPACAERIVATDRVEGVAEALAAAHGIRTAADLAAVAASADLVILLVKPQDIAAASAAIGPALGDGACVASAAAGVELAGIRAALGTGAPLARFMPNIPVAVGGGVSAVCGDPAAVERLVPWLEAVGSAVAMDESMFDAATAISGSGPGLYAYVIEQFEAAARALGFGPDEARRLAVDTFAGTGRYLAETGESPAALRERVTSPGGTTAAGLAQLEAHGLGAAVAAAAGAARDRGRELREGGA